jgi:hypothetical protein
LRTQQGNLLQPTKQQWLEILTTILKHC